MLLFCISSSKWTGPGKRSIFQNVDAFELDLAGFCDGAIKKKKTFRDSGGGGGLFWGLEMIRRFMKFSYLPEIKRVFTNIKTGNF